MSAETRSASTAALAYDRIAADYDRQVQSSQWMRSVLWDAYRRLFQPGQRVLDLSCGTGIDALFLAQLGIRVVGLDISPRMIEQLELKARRLGLRDRIEVCLRDLNTIQPRQSEVGPLEGVRLPDTEPFDGIISAFAGLNTLPDLTPLAAEAARLLKPGGHLLVHMLNRFSIWSALEHLRRGRWRDARQAVNRTTMTAIIGGVAVQHYLYFPGEAYRRFFANHFILRRSYALGILRPLNAPRWLTPSLLNTLETLERKVANHKPFVNWGSFFVLEMQKRDATRHG